MKNWFILASINSLSVVSKHEPDLFEVEMLINQNL